MKPWRSRAAWTPRSREIAVVARFRDRPDDGRTVGRLQPFELVLKAYSLPTSLELFHYEGFDL